MHVYDQYFQTSFSLKQLCISKRDEFIKWSRSHYQDGRHAHIWPKPLQSSSLELSMDHQGLKVYKGYINDDPGLTLTYFTAISYLVKIAYCAISTVSHFSYAPLFQGPHFRQKCWNQAFFLIIYLLTFFSV